MIICYYLFTVFLIQSKILKNSGSYLENRKTYHLRLFALESNLASEVVVVYKKRLFHFEKEQTEECDFTHFNLKLYQIELHIALLALLTLIIFRIGS